jgi:hypothetical protein
MPNPKGARRLVAIGSTVKFAKSKIEVPVEVKDYEDYVAGTRYPKMAPKKVWFVYIEIPKDLLDDIKEGSIDLAGQTINLEELDDSYDEDLDKDNLAQVFISKIMTEPNTEEQIKVLYDLGWRLKEIRSHEVSKKTNPKIKEAINIIRDNYNKYETQITPTEKKNETEKCKTILSGDVNAPSVRACFHLTAFYSG